MKKLLGRIGPHLLMLTNTPIEVAAASKMGVPSGLFICRACETGDRIEYSFLTDDFTCFKCGLVSRSVDMERLSDPERESFENYQDRRSQSSFGLNVGVQGSD